MNTRTAAQYGALAGAAIGVFAVAITPRPGVGGIVSMMVLAVAIPVLIIYMAGEDMKHRRLSVPPMSKESEEASGLFAKATEILRAPATALPQRIDPALATSKSRVIREAAKALCDALESGATLSSIDDKAKALGMEVLSVQSMTLQARKRNDK